MLAVQLSVPCFEWSSHCRLDWAAVSALGGWGAVLVGLIAAFIGLIAAVGSWLAAVATFFAVYVPARMAKQEAARRANRERQISYIEINRLLPKVLDIRGQVRTIRAKIVPAVPELIARSKSSSAQIAALLQIKGAVPFAILSEGLEMISMGVSNLQTAMEVYDDFLRSGAEIEIYGNHPFHRIADHEDALMQVELAVRNLLLAIKKFAKVNVDLFDEKGAEVS